MANPSFSSTMDAGTQMTMGGLKRKPAKPRPPLPNPQRQQETGIGSLIPSYLPRIAGGGMDYNTASNQVNATFGPPPAALQSMFDHLGKPKPTPAPWEGINNLIPSYLGGSPRGGATKAPPPNPRSALFQQMMDQIVAGSKSTGPGRGAFGRIDPNTADQYLADHPSMNAMNAIYNRDRSAERQPQPTGPNGPYNAAMAGLNQQFPGMPVGQAPPPKEYEHGPGGVRDFQRGMMQSPYGGVRGNFEAPVEAPVPEFSPQGASIGQREAAVMRQMREAQQTTQGGPQLMPFDMEYANDVQHAGQLAAQGFPMNEGVNLTGDRNGAQGIAPQRMIPDGQGGMVPMPRSGAITRNYSEEQKQEMAGRREQFRNFRNMQAQMAMQQLAQRPAQARAQRTEEAKQAKLMRQIRLGKAAPPEGQQMNMLQQMALNGNPAALAMVQGVMRNNQAGQQMNQQMQHEINRDNARFAHDRDMVGAREQAEQDRIAGTPQGQADALELKAKKEKQTAERNADRNVAATAWKNENPIEAATYLSQFEGQDLIDEAQQLGITPEKLVQMMRQDQSIGIGGMGRSIAGFFTNPAAQAGIDSQRQAETGSAYRRRKYEHPDEQNALKTLLERLRQAHTSQPGFNGIG